MSGEDFLQALEDDARDLREKNIELKTALSSNTAYQSQTDTNLIEFQLDTKEMLEKIEHFLKGDIAIIDQEGNEYWTKQPNEDLILFNEYGVNSIMLIIGNYIDKNTMLSYYTEDRINEIMGDLGDELANFLFCNYEIMGMNTEFKKTRFPLTVLTILHSVESAYRRAIRGSTMENLNTSKIFTQSDIIGGGRMQQQIKKKFHLLRHSTWGG